MGKKERMDKTGTREERKRRRLSGKGEEERDGDKEPTGKAILISFVSGSQEMFPPFLSPASIMAFLLG